MILLLFSCYIRDICIAALRLFRSIQTFRIHTNCEVSRSDRARVDEDANEAGLRKKNCAKQMPIRIYANKSLFTRSLSAHKHLAQNAQAQKIRAKLLNLHTPTADVLRTGARNIACAGLLRWCVSPSPNATPFPMKPFKMRRTRHSA